MCLGEKVDELGIFRQMGECMILGVRLGGRKRSHRGPDGEEGPGLGEAREPGSWTERSCCGGPPRGW